MLGAQSLPTIPRCLPIIPEEREKTLAIVRFANIAAFMYSNSTFTFSGTHGSAPKQAATPKNP